MTLSAFVTFNRHPFLPIVFTQLRHITVEEKTNYQRVFIEANEFRCSFGDTWSGHPSKSPLFFYILFLFFVYLNTIAFYRNDEEKSIWHQQQQPKCREQQGRQFNDPRRAIHYSHLCAYIYFIINRLVMMNGSDSSFLLLLGGLDRVYSDRSIRGGLGRLFSPSSYSPFLSADQCFLPSSSSSSLQSENK